MLFFQPWIFETLSNEITGVVTKRVLERSTECKNTSLLIIFNSSVETDVTRFPSLFRAHFFKACRPINYPRKLEHDFRERTGSV